MEFEIYFNGCKDGPRGGQLLVPVEVPIDPSAEEDTSALPKCVPLVEAALTDQWVTVRTMSELLQQPRETVREALRALIYRKVAERHASVTASRRKRLVFYRRVASA